MQDVVYKIQDVRCRISALGSLRNQPAGVDVPHKPSKRQAL